MLQIFSFLQELSVILFAFKFFIIYHSFSKNTLHINNGPLYFGN